MKKTPKTEAFDPIAEADRIVQKMQTLQAPNYEEKYYCVKVNFDTSIDDVLIHIPYPIHSIIESAERNPKQFILILPKDKEKTDILLKNEAKAKKKERE